VSLISIEGKAWVSLRVSKKEFGKLHMATGARYKTSKGGLEAEKTTELQYTQGVRKTYNVPKGQCPSEAEDLCEPHFLICQGRSLRMLTIGEKKRLREGERVVWRKVGQDELIKGEAGLRKREISFWMFDLAKTDQLRGGGIFKPR